ncbi:hypothetical protein [Hungatella hathewayi]|uniref:hypothetical protein n=1 Tax=Hungatella hathewayi TaxID=154046 RepID=UPI003562F4B3
MEEERLNGKMDKKEIEEMQSTDGLLEGESPLSIPESLLKEAGIDIKADLDVVCNNGSITITEADDAEILVPKAILNLCAEFGISPEKVKLIMSKEGLYGRR